MHSVEPGTTHPTHWDVVVVMANGLRFEDSGWTLDQAYGVYEGYFETRSEAHEQGQRIARRLETRGHRFIGIHVYPRMETVDTSNIAAVRSHEASVQGRRLLETTSEVDAATRAIDALRLVDEDDGGAGL